jgi:hypothetical protein
MIEGQKDDSLLTVADLREFTMPVANDNWIGMWVNGMSEAGVLLLMKQKVPCFIVHKFPPETPVPHSAAPHPPTFFSFVEGTDVVYLVRHNAYQLLAENQGRLLAMAKSDRKFDFEGFCFKLFAFLWPNSQSMVNLAWISTLGSEVQSFRPNVLSNFKIV